MSWNYRVVKEEDGFYSICEVYYNKDGKIDGWISAPTFIFEGSSVKELQENLDRVRKAFDKPILKQVGIQLVEE
jgi:hypothetical protein